MRQLFGGQETVKWRVTRDFNRFFIYIFFTAQEESGEPNEKKKKEKMKTKKGYSLLATPT